VFAAGESRPLPGTFSALGLSGRNKPNGLEYRLRQSVPDDVPDFVPLRQGGLELWIADPTREGWMAFYRTPLGEAAGTSRNATYRAVLYAPSGERLWDLDLNRFLSRPDHLEIQDIRYSDGELYFNEACQSYAREADGRCSALLRVDPRRGTVVWRTGPRVSNDIFLVHGPVLIAGYGFTAEPDSLYLVARSSGEIVDRTGLDSAHDYLEVIGNTLTVVTTARVYRFTLPPR
jgi:hypothetical protein